MLRQVTCVKREKQPAHSCKALLKNIPQVFEEYSLFLFERLFVIAVQIVLLGVITVGCFVFSIFGTSLDKD